MSIPASLRGGPTTTNALASKRFLFIHILLIWLSSLLPLLLFWLLWPAYYINPLWFFIITPFWIMICYLVWVMSAILCAKLVLIIVNLIHKPREGYFKRSNYDIDYRYWSLRATIKKFALWIVHNWPLPWVDMVAFNFFGVKVRGGTVLFDAWVDVEFIEIGKNTIVGQGSVIMSTMVTRDWLIIKKVKIGSNCVIGAHSVVSPGTVIGDNSVLGALAGTSVGQELEAGWVYMGVPARKYKKNEYQSLEESEEEEARKRGTFKQYLTIEEMEQVEEKSWRERRAERKQEREIRKQEKKQEKQEKQDKQDKKPEKQDSTETSVASSVNDSDPSVKASEEKTE